jgi:hypothetical protein
LDFGPSGPALPTPARYAPLAAGSPLSPSRIHVFAERRILFDLAHSGRDAFSLSRHRHVGPSCQLHPFPHVGLPLPFLLVASGHPHRPASPSDAARAITRPAIISPLNPPLNLAPVFNGVKAINASVTPPGHPSPTLPRPL